MTVTWRNYNLVQPQAVVYTDTTGLATVGLAASGILAIIGTAEGGVPNTATAYVSATDARNDFRGGNLLTAAENAWAEGARQLYLTRVGATSGTALNYPCQQASLTLQASAYDTVMITSRGYGSWTNNIRAKVESGTTSGVKVTLQYYNSSTGVTTVESQDNLVNAAAIGGWLGNTSTLCSGTVLNGILVPDTIAYTNLAGGGDGLSPTTTDWQNAIALYDEIPVDLIHVSSTDSIVHNLLSTAVTNASNNKYERIGVVGGALSMSVGDMSTNPSIINSAYNLNSDRMVYVSPGTDAVAPSFTASKVAGLIASVDVATPMTHQTINSDSIETKFTSPQKNSLITYGTTAIEEVLSGRRIIRGITTAQDLSATNEHPFKEISVRRIADYVSKTIRDNLEALYIGKKGVNGVTSSIAGTVTSLLLQLKEQQIIVGFKDVVVSQSPDNPTVYYVSYRVAPIQPINYILITTVLTNTL